MLENDAAVLKTYRFVTILLVSIGLTACSAQQQRFGKAQIDPKLGVAPSPRVVADGEPVPRGGGNYMVGKPYTIAGKTYYPTERSYSATGIASWYGDDFHGRRTANGEVFDKLALSAAHPTLPLPSYARVTNLRNHRSIIVRVNDRGPYHGGRVMDVSSRVADALDFKRLGMAKVKVDYVGRASLAGSDDEKLMATLRIDGNPATLDQSGGGITEVARNDAITQSTSANASPVIVASNAPVQLGNEGSNDETPAPVPRPSEEQEGSETMAQPGAGSAGKPLISLDGKHGVKPVLAASASNVPLPPERPFDLSTIPGAGTPISAPKTHNAANSR